LFDHNGKISKYASVEDILKEFFPLRETLYERRKEYQLARLRKECEILENKVRFILGVNSGLIKIQGVKRQLLVDRLHELEFKTIS